MKIIAFTDKKFLEYDDLIKRMEELYAIFYDSYINDLSQIFESTDEDEKILMLYVNVVR